MHEQPISKFICLVCLLLHAVLSLSNLYITLALCLLFNFCTIEYLVKHKIFLHAWAANYFPPHHMLFLSAVLYYNKLKRSKNHPSTFDYYLLSVKWNFVFTLRSSGPAKPDQPDCLLWPCDRHHLKNPVE